MAPAEIRALRLAKRILLGPAEMKRVQNVVFKDTGLGYDKFGLCKESGILAYSLLRLVHQHYFRVESRGIENLPKEGGVILASNHGGVVPWDGAMIAVDVMTKTDPPRIPRNLVGRGAYDLPLLGLLLARMGQVAGTRRNFRELLKEGHPVIVFPEGTKAMMKSYRDRYRLRTFHVGHVELALERKAPIVPVGVVGAEEQMPLLFASKPLGKLVGFPFVPITPFFPHLGPLGLIPLPTRYHIRYGKPIHFRETASRAALKDPEALEEMARNVRMQVQLLVDEGLNSRRGVFQ